MDHLESQNGSYVRIKTSPKIGPGIGLAWKSVHSEPWEPQKPHLLYSGTSPQKGTPRRPFRRGKRRPRRPIESEVGHNCLEPPPYPTQIPMIPLKEPRPATLVSLACLACLASFASLACWLHQLLWRHWPATLATPSVVLISETTPISCQLDQNAANPIKADNNRAARNLVVQGYRTVQN